MPPLPGMELGAPPPPAPRRLPASFVRRTRWNVGTLFGLALFVFGGLMTVAIFFAKPLAALFPGFFALGGFFILKHSLQTAAQTLRAFRLGRATPGRVFSLGRDTTQRINQQHPFKLVYHYDVAGHQHEGTLISFDSTLATRRCGQPLWVLALEDEPTHSALYPPVA
jgi:hypothetical protein